jgi:hypothetical protein
MNYELGKAETELREARQRLAEAEEAMTPAVRALVEVVREVYAWSVEVDPPCCGSMHSEEEHHPWIERLSTILAAVEAEDAQPVTEEEVRAAIAAHNDEWKECNEAGLSLDECDTRAMTAALEAVRGRNPQGK